MLKHLARAPTSHLVKLSLQNIFSRESRIWVGDKKHPGVGNMKHHRGYFYVFQGHGLVCNIFKSAPPPQCYHPDHFTAVQDFMRFSGKCCKMPWIYCNIVWGGGLNVRRVSLFLDLLLDLILEIYSLSTSLHELCQSRLIFGKQIPCVFGFLKSLQSSQRLDLPFAQTTKDCTGLSFYVFLYRNLVLLIFSVADPEAG